MVIKKHVYEYRRRHGGGGGGGVSNPPASTQYLTDGQGNVLADGATNKLSWYGMLSVATNYIIDGATQNTLSDGAGNTLTWI